MAPPRKGKRGLKKSDSLPTNVALEENNQDDFEKAVKEIKRKGLQDKQTPGVVYLGRIPHGFYEEQMKSFFSQFGKVTKLKLLRSKKTGRSRGYAFIEFEYEEVAKIVAETMHNYLMFERLLHCQFIPQSEVHPNTFNGWNMPFRPGEQYLKAINRHNKPRSDKQVAVNMSRFIRKNQKQQEKLAALGIDFKFEGLEEIQKEKDSLVAKINENQKIEMKELQKEEKLKKKKKEKENKKREAKIEEKRRKEEESRQEEEIKASPSKQKSSKKNKPAIPKIPAKRRKISQSGEIAVLKRGTDIDANLTTSKQEVESPAILKKPKRSDKLAKFTPDIQSTKPGVKKPETGGRDLRSRTSSPTKKPVKKKLKKE